VLTPRLLLVVVVAMLAQTIWKTGNEIDFYSDLNVLVPTQCRHHSSFS
jgi:hypothetical protein